MVILIIKGNIDKIIKNENDFKLSAIINCDLISSVERNMH